jgi:hypothetical protein
VLGVGCWVLGALGGGADPGGPPCRRGPDGPDASDYHARLAAGHCQASISPLPGSKDGDYPCGTRGKSLPILAGIVTRSLLHWGHRAWRHGLVSPTAIVIRTGKARANGRFRPVRLVSSRARRDTGALSAFRSGGDPRGVSGELGGGTPRQDCRLLAVGGSVRPPLRESRKAGAPTRRPGKRSWLPPRLFFLATDRDPAPGRFPVWERSQFQADTGWEGNEGCKEGSGDRRTERASQQELHGTRPLRERGAVMRGIPASPVRMEPQAEEEEESFEAAA